MNNNSTKFCYKNACIEVDGEAAKTINKMLTFGLLLIIIATIGKALS
jgi:hypothetical protein